jgi:predicted dehydrogenase
MSERSVGIVGAGVIASSMHIPVLRAMPGVRIDWIMDAQHERAAHLAKLNRTRAVPPEALVGLAPVDFVLLALPLPPRGSYFSALAASQTTILAEKPLANSLAEHDALVAEFADWRLAVGYQRRYYAQFRLMQQIIATGTFGPLRSIAIVEGGRITRTGGGGDYQTLPCSKGGGIVKNLGCHGLDLALWLAEAEDFAIVDKDLEVDDGADLTCRAQIVLKAADGRECGLDFAASWLGRMDNHVSFRFDAVQLICSVGPADHIVVQSPGGQMIGKLNANGMGAVTSAQAFYLQWQAVMDAAAAQVPQPLSARVTRPVAALMDSLLADVERRP